ncbi:MAG: hypothetical protein IKS67_00045, partial [Victivallales bacterium]|nr:hypothetical protein [Victivallales bacterium]
ARDATLEAIEFAEAHGHRLFEDPAGAGWSDAERGRKVAARKKNCLPIEKYREIMDSFNSFSTTCQSGHAEA